MVVNPIKTLIIYNTLQSQSTRFSTNCFVDWCFNHRPFLMIKKTLLPIVLLFAIICHPQEYFEGEIQYKVEYEALNKHMSAEYMAKEFGDSFTAYIKEDRYAMVYNGSGTKGWMKVIIRLDEGCTYTEYEKVPTISKKKFSPEKNELLLFERNHKEQKNVLGEKCESVTMKQKPSEDTPFLDEITGTHYFSPRYKLNAEKYKDHQEGYWNKYVDESGAISIRNETEYSPFFITTSEAISVKTKEMDDGLFEPNPNKDIRLEE